MIWPLQDLDCAGIMEELTRVLKKNRDLYNVIAIPTAKVPIVKFRHRPAQLDGDISLYNTLVSKSRTQFTTLVDNLMLIRVLHHGYCSISNAKSVQGKS